MVLLVEANSDLVLSRSLLTVLNLFDETHDPKVSAINATDKTCNFIIIDFSTLKVANTLLNFRR
jgi:hypothetical protein